MQNIAYPHSRNFLKLESDSFPKILRKTISKCVKVAKTDDSTLNLQQLISMNKTSFLNPIGLFRAGSMSEGQLLKYQIDYLKSISMIEKTRDDSDAFSKLKLSLFAEEMS
ncbi:hypothetical protein MHBO_000769 [Bonamia ostreae]|uniref:Uncharacterized protein n=1 Tax=Bonamia ostreae TaxID=126728 RepID=A0ABV2AGR4_9EUKA